MGKVTDLSFDRQSQWDADKAGGVNVRLFLICNDLCGLRHPRALVVDSMPLRVELPVDVSEVSNLRREICKAENWSTDSKTPCR